MYTATREGYSVKRTWLTYIKWCLNAMAKNEHFFLLKTLRQWYQICTVFNVLSLMPLGSISRTCIYHLFFRFKHVWWSVVKITWKYIQLQLNCVKTTKLVFFIAWPFPDWFNLLNQHACVWERCFCENTLCYIV